MCSLQSLIIHGLWWMVKGGYLCIVKDTADALLGTFR